MNRLSIWVCLVFLIITSIFLTSCGDVNYEEYVVGVQYADETPYDGEIIIQNYGKVKVESGKVNFRKHLDELRNIVRENYPRCCDITMVIPPTEKSGAHVLNLQMSSLEAGRIITLNPVKYDVNAKSYFISRDFQLKTIQNNFDQYLGNILMWIEGGNYEFVSDSQGVISGHIGIPVSEDVPINFIFYDPNSVYEVKIVSKKFPAVKPSYRSLPMSPKEFTDDDDFRLDWAKNRYFTINLKNSVDVPLYADQVDFDSKYCRMDRDKEKYLFVFTAYDEVNKIKYGISFPTQPGLNEVVSDLTLKKNYLPVGADTVSCFSAANISEDVVKFKVNVDSLELKEVPADVQKEIDERWGFWDWMLVILISVAGIFLSVIFFMTIPALIFKMRKSLKKRIEAQYDQERKEMDILGILAYYDLAEQLREKKKKIKSDKLSGKVGLLLNKVYVFFDEIKKQTEEKRKIDTDIISLSSTFQDKVNQLRSQYEEADDDKKNIIDSAVKEITAQLDGIKKLKGTLEDAILSNKTSIKSLLEEIQELFNAESFSSDYDDLMKRIDEISSRYELRQQQVKQLLQTDEEKKLNEQLNLKKKEIK